MSHAPRSGTTRWRVSGIKRNGERIRENFANAQEAQYRCTEVGIAAQLTAAPRCGPHV